MAIGTLAYKILADHKGFTQGVVATRKELTQAKRITESMKGPLDRYQDEVNQASVLLKKGALSQDAFNAAVARSRAQVLSAIPGIASLKSMLGQLFAAYALFATARGIIKLAADAEQAEVAFTNMLGSAEAAQKTLSEIEDFSAKTPFEPQELREAGQLLLAFSVAQDDLIPTMKTLGDLSAGTNKRLIEFVRILGKVKDRGKISAETLSEFGGRSVPLTRALGEVLGKTNGEIQKMASQGKISFDEMMQALQHLTSEGQLFGGAMEKQSQTLAGIWSTFTGNIKLLGTTIGVELLSVLSATVRWMNSLIETVKSFGNPLTTSTGKMVIFVGTFAMALVLLPKMAAGILAVVAAVRAYATASAIAQAFSGPKGWITVAASVAVAAGAVAATSAAFKAVDQDVKAATSAAKENTDAAREMATAHDELKLSINAETDALNRQRELDRRGLSITEQLKTKSEKALDFVRELNQLVDVGSISWETYRRGVEKARQEMRDAVQERNSFEVTAPKLTVRGSQAAFEQIVNRQLQIESDNADKMLSLEERQVEQLEELIQNTEEQVHVTEHRF